MNKTIVLVGPRSVGKSSIGEVLAGKLGYEHINFDVFSEKKLKEEGYASVNAYLDVWKAKSQSYGWKEYGLWQQPHFKEMVAYLKSNPAVLDLGGGLLSEDFEDKKVNLSVLQSINPVIEYILPSQNKEEGLKILVERELQRKHWKDLGWGYDRLYKKTLEDYDNRHAFFSSCADHIVYVEGRNSQDVALEIVKNVT